MQVTDDGLVLDGRVTVRHDASLQTGLSWERSNHLCDDLAHRPAALARPRFASADDLERKPWRAAVRHRVGDLLPVDLAARPGPATTGSQPREPCHPPFMHSRSSWLIATWHALVSGTPIFDPPCQAGLLRRLWLRSLAGRQPHMDLGDHPGFAARPPASAAACSPGPRPGPGVGRHGR